MIKKQCNNNPKGGTLWDNIAYWKDDSKKYVLIFPNMGTSYHTAGKYTKIFSKILSETEVIMLLESDLEYNDLSKKNIYDIAIWLDWNRDKMLEEQVKPLRFNREKVCRPRFFSPRFDLPSHNDSLH